MKLYQDRDWLHTKYWDEELSLKEISGLANTNPETIHRWMVRNNIARRSTAGMNKRANHVNLSSYANEILTGTLLGDSYIDCRKSRQSSRINFKYKYLEHVIRLSGLLESFGIERSEEIRTIINVAVNNCVSYSYRSKSYIELRDIRNKWYVAGKKIVPKDILLTPATCMQWFLDDGSLCVARKKTKTNHIMLHTNGFTKQDVSMLIGLLSDIGIQSHITLRNEIYISAGSTERFLSYIGKCPQDLEHVYGYKFSLTRRGTIEDWRKKNNLYPHQ